MLNRIIQSLFRDETLTLCATSLRKLDLATMHAQAHGWKTVGGIEISAYDRRGDFTDDTAYFYRTVQRRIWDPYWSRIQD